VTRRIVTELLDKGFQPFAFGSRRNLEMLHPEPFQAPLRMLASDDPEWLHMHQLINRMNGVAYGSKDMGMPAWVQIDCGVLPSAFVGFGRPASDLPERLQWQMGLTGDEGFVPVAEAISIPTIHPGLWSSFSMCTVLGGYGLGYASKLLSLRAYGARYTLGVAQYDNFALRIHTRFGALELTEPFVPYHTCPDNTFVYRLDLRGGHVLDRLERGEVLADEREPTFWLDSHDSERMVAMSENVRAGTHRYWLLPPGADRYEGGIRCPIFEAVVK
jgi:hypothetical protein